MLLNENTGFCTRRIGLIHKLSIDSRSLKWSAQDVLLNIFFIFSNEVNNNFASFWSGAEDYLLDLPIRRQDSLLSYNKSRYCF